MLSTLHVEAGAQQPVDTLVTAGLAFPVDLVFPRPQRIYVAERRGVVRVVEGGVLLPQWLIDLREEVGNWGDHGMLGIALDPAFAQNGFLYLAYVVDRHHLLHHGTGGYSALANEYLDATVLRITRYTCDPATDQLSVVPSSRLVLLGESAATGPAVTSSTHGACSLLFGRDGTLLFGTGDGAGGYLDTGSAPQSYYAQALTDGILTPATNVGALRAQQIDSLNGKILRLDPATGDGVPSNPFFDPAQPRSARSRVFALGLRNPCRLSLRPDTGATDAGLGQPGELWLGDVGWTSREEVDVVTEGGQNFGWPLFEGMTPQPQYAGRVANSFAPNPLGSTCAAPFFRFQDLLLDDDGTSLFVPNPCNPGVAVVPATPSFWHRRPLLDWAHTGRDARVAVPNGGGSVNFPQIGSPASGVVGAPFQGECSIGGAWQSGITFPARFGPSYYHADFSAGWIRRLTIGTNGELVSVEPFADVLAPVRLVEGPDHALYYVSYAPAHAVRRLGFGVEPPPIAVATTSGAHGPSPLAIEADARASHDPDRQTVTYQWLVDGVKVSSAPQTRIEVVANGSGPELHNLQLQVEDPFGAIGTVDVPVSLGNTPPRISSTSVEEGGFFSTTTPDVLTLQAVVDDAEQSPTTLGYAWQTTLHRGSQRQPGPEVPLAATTTTLTPTPDDGRFCAYSIALTVTDSTGLSATRTAWFFPDRPQANTSVALTRPVAGDVILAGSPTILGAIATGPVRRVEFRVDDTLVGIATDLPYEVPWTPAGDGPVTASALVVAMDGTSRSSRGTTVHVKAPVHSMVRAAAVDDAREDLSTAPGPLLGENELRLGDDNGPQVVAVRFAGLPPSSGARIRSAHVDFTAAAPDAGPAWILLACEASPMPTPFQSVPGDLVFRPPGTPLWWFPPPWSPAESGPAQRTPDLASLMQPLVDDPSWNNDLVLLFYGFVGARRATSADGDPSVAPLLVLDWVPADPVLSTLPVALGSEDSNEGIDSGQIDLTAPKLVLGGDVGEEQITGLRFVLPIPNGATIDSARLRFTAAVACTGPAELQLRVEDADDAPPFVVARLDLSDRPASSASVVWTPPEWLGGQCGPSQRSPELRSLLQALVERPGWNAGNACVVLIQGIGTRLAYSRDAWVRTAPRLEVAFH
ncbi:MAG: PQQ-dependent sugar dehydrogenase [Planctomycetes bacterium]|nr:PQQ-dependent sugar dehydrogenase [Planctomycetota bacterium]